jgi:spore coat protein U-like protein
MSSSKNRKNCKYWPVVRTIGCVAAITGLFAATVTLASGTTTAVPSQGTLAPTCTIDSASTLDFGNQGVLAANVDQISTIEVTCTSTTPYNIGLDAGAGSGATVATRKMTSGSAAVSYSLYSDSDHTTIWGATVGTDVVAATGNGASQSYTVYGLVPPQATPAPGIYTDTITVTVTY